jgi:hypothetical protein
MLALAAPLLTGLLLAQGSSSGAAPEPVAQVISLTFTSSHGVLTMVVPLPAPERARWDAPTAAAMQRLGISPSSPRAASRAAKAPVEGFRVVEIIHIYSEDRCRE